MALLYQGRGLARLAAWSFALLLGIFSCTAQAATVQYVYDELGRLIAEIDPTSDTTLYSYDAAGNLVSVSRNSSAQFSIISFTPTRGKVGDAVTIFGSGFIANPAQNSVSFNGTPATVTSATTTTLVATVPSGVTTGPITVTNANGTAISAQVFTVSTPPLITGVTPSLVGRAVTVRVEISGSHLASARAVTFSQAGITAAILPGATNQLLAVNLSVSASVPVGSYGFSVTNEAGPTESGAVTVTVTTALLGDTFSVTQPLSVYLPASIAGAPPGNAMSVSQSLSVHLPASIPGAPPGNAMSVTQPVSVSMP